MSDNDGNGETASSFELKFHQLIGEWKEFKKNTDEYRSEIKEGLQSIDKRLKEGNKCFNEISQLCSERGPRIERLEADVEDLRKKGATKGEKTAIAGSYVLQIILEAIRRVWPM